MAPTRNSKSARQRSTAKAPVSLESESPVIENVSVDQRSSTTKLLLTPQEAAEALAINRSTLYLLLMRGEIPSITIGRARRIPLRALEHWIDQQIVS